MAVTVSFLLFLAGTAVSLSTSYLLVTRLERIGERLGLSEGLLGVVAALAADAPEITSAVTALTHHQSRVGAGVIIGSNVFNLAALLGLGAVVAGSIALHRKVVLLGGVTGIWIAAVCLVTVLGVIPPAGGALAVLAVLLPYLVVLGAGHARLQRLAQTLRWEAWLALAVTEEEQELGEVIHPPRGRRLDFAVAAVALVVVVVASVVMERAASLLGIHFAIPGIVTGGVILPAATRLPNAVAAMSEIGIDISGHRSKSVDEFRGQPFDYVLTVCDGAKETCPVFPGPARQFHQDFEDPAAAPADQQLAVFRKVRDELRCWLEELIPEFYDPSTR